MPALDFTTWPSKPAAPPAVSAGAPRQTARADAPKTGPNKGSSGAANGEFGQLVDRLADAPDEGQVSARGAMTRGLKQTQEESAAEPRAKGDADGASGTANDAPAVLASMASNPAPFPWTLPLSPSLWNLDQVQGDGASAGETGESVDGDGVMNAITGAIADGAAGACLATLPGAGTDAETSTAFTVPVDAPIAVDPAGASGAASTSASQATGAKDASAIDADEIDATAWTAAAATAGSALLEHEVAPSVAGLGNDHLTNGALDGAALANAAVTETASGDAAVGQSGVHALASGSLEHVSSINPNDSTPLARSAMDSATTAAAVGDFAATTAVAQTGQANAAIDAALPGDQAREQALIELQRALEAARANGAPATAKPRSGNADAPIVIQTGTPVATAPDDADAAASAEVAIDAASTAGAGSSVFGALTGESGAGATVASASARTSRSRDAAQPSEEFDIDSATTGASSWAAAAVAKYAEAAGAGTSSGADTPDSGSNADAAANIALAGRAGGDAGLVAPIGFDARVHAATRVDAAPDLPEGWAESAVVTTAEPGEQAAQIVRSMRLQWRGANGEATLRLQPDHLGHVFVNVRVEQGTVSATVRAETPAAQQWIQQHQQQLRDALDAQGLRVAQFHVTSNPDDRPRRDHEQDQNQDATGRRSSRARARRGDDDRRFEVHL